MEVPSHRNPLLMTKERISNRVCEQSDPTFCLASLREWSPGSWLLVPCSTDLSRARTSKGRVADTYASCTIVVFSFLFSPPACLCGHWSGETSVDRNQVSPSIEHSHTRSKSRFGHPLFDEEKAKAMLMSKGTNCLFATAPPRFKRWTTCTTARCHFSFLVSFFFPPLLVALEF